MQLQGAEMPDLQLALDVLLEGANPALWDPYTKREALRFLRKRGSDLSKRDLSRLANAILIGPSPERYRNDKADNEWHKLRDHMTRLRLHKLVESGATLPKPARKRYDQIQRDSPWEPRGDFSEEFTFFLRSGPLDGNEPDKVEDFATMSTASFIEWASQQTGNPWDCGGGWDVFVEREPEVALTLLQGAAERGSWPIPPWYGALFQFHQSAHVPAGLAGKVAATLEQMPEEELAELALQAAEWLKHRRRMLGKRCRQRLWRLIWNASLVADAPEGDLDYNRALSHAGGVLGSVIYDEMADYIPSVPPANEAVGLPKQLRADFEMIAEGEDPSAKLARVQNAPHLHILYRIDPDWTARAFFSRMDLDNAAAFDPFLWEAYLWSPQFTDDLLGAFKALFFKILGDLKALPDNVRHQGPELFVYMAIPPRRGITTDEAKAVLYKMAPDELAQAASSLRRLLGAAGEKSPNLWRDTIGPWFHQAWPKRPVDRSRDLSQSLASMAVDARDAFPDVVHAVASLILPEEWDFTLHHLMKKEEEGKLVTRFPWPALTLVAQLVSDETRVDGDTLSTLLDAISTAAPELRENDSFKRLALKAAP